MNPIPRNELARSEAENREIRKRRRRASKKL